MIFWIDFISFSIEKGELVAITGPSGSGKSTLLHMLGGVDRPSSGQIFYDNSNICTRDNNSLAVFRRRHIGLIYQFYDLIPTLNVEENITLPLLLDGREPDRTQLNDIMQTIGLSGLAKRLPNTLSGGQQQRVSIGRALLGDPSVILADEPTGNLDSKNSRDVLELLISCNKKYNQTTIIATHDERIAAQTDRIIKIEDGKIVSDEAVK